MKKARAVAECNGMGEGVIADPVSGRSHLGEQSGGGLIAQLLADDKERDAHRPRYFYLTKTERRNSVLAGYDFARRNGFKFNLTYLPKEIPDKGSVEFETGYMRSLFAYGYELGRSGQAWQSSPPQLH